MESFEKQQYVKSIVLTYYNIFFVIEALLFVIINKYFSELIWNFSPVKMYYMYYGFVCISYILKA